MADLRLDLGAEKCIENVNSVLSEDKGLPQLVEGSQIHSWSSMVQNLIGSWRDDIGVENVNQSATISLIENFEDGRNPAYGQTARLVVYCEEHALSENIFDIDTWS